MAKGRRKRNSAAVTQPERIDSRSERRKVLEAEIATFDARERAISQAGISIIELIRFAEGGNELSIGTLLIIATLSIGALNGNVLEKYPDIVRRLSRMDFAWPGMISRKRSLIEANEKLMNNLQLHEGSNIFSQKKWQLSKPSTQAALALLLPRLRKEDLSVRPPLTKKEKREWFDEAWEGILASGIRPEHVEKLAALGKSKATKRPKYCKNLHPATRDANVRAEIKRRIWKAFDNLVTDARTQMKSSRKGNASS